MFWRQREWLEDQFQEIEKLSCTAKQMFQKIRQIAGKRSLMPSTKCVKLKGGRILQDTEDVSKWWQEYNEALFYDDQEGEDIILHSVETGPRILKNEVRWALKNKKTGKQAGPDDISVEMLIALEADGIDLVWEIVNKVYKTGNFPETCWNFFRCMAKYSRYTRLRKSQNHNLDKTHSQRSTEDRSSASEMANYTRNTWKPIWIHVRSRNQECNLHSQNAQRTSYLASTGCLHAFYWLQEGVQQSQTLRFFQDVGENTNWWQRSTCHQKPI